MKALRPIFIIILVFYSFQSIADGQFRMPTVKDVLTKIHGKDRTETYLKQAGTFAQLRAILEVQDGERTDSLTKEEKKIADAYLAEYKKLVKKSGAKWDDYQPNKTALRIEYYSVSWKFREEVYKAFFTPGFKTKFDESVKDYFGHGNRPISIYQENSESPYEKEDREAVKITFITIILTLFCLFWFLKTIFKTKGQFKANPNNPRQFHIGKREYDINSYTGIVVDGTETLSTVSNGSNTISRTVTNKFFILEQDGTEHAVTLVNSGIMVRAGSLVSALWIKRPNAEAGNYFCFYNHNTKQVTWVRSAMSYLGYSKLPVLPLLLFGCGAAILIKQLLINMSTTYSIDPITVGTNMIFDTPIICMIPVSILIIYLINATIVYAGRKKTFEKHFSVNILPEIKVQVNSSN